MNKALKASWVNRFKNDISSPWKIIPDYMAHHLGAGLQIPSVMHIQK